MGTDNVFNVSVKLPGQLSKVGGRRQLTVVIRGKRMREREENIERPGGNTPRLLQKQQTKRDQKNHGRCRERDLWDFVKTCS